MRVLVIGSGAREHTLAWKLSTSRQVERVFVAPGNASTHGVGTNVGIQADDIPKLAMFARRYGIDLTVVGPEDPLANGIVDRFQMAGLTAFGPTRDGARIEASKSFARMLMRKYDIPSPEFKIFNNYGDGYEFISNHEGQVVVKADGLAGGKGALICRDQEAAINALYDCMEDRIFGAAGATVVVEELLEGQEISVFAFTDGETVSSLVAACDYKRLLDGDRGLNTGGMGSYSPADVWDEEMERKVRKEVMEPVVRGMANEGYPYRGVLYAGLMLTHDGIRVLEFNCRLGDPETQVILPQMKSDLADVMLATMAGSLKKTKVDWGGQSCVGVVIASRGYPGEYRRGLEIDGLDTVDEDILVFHAGTRREASQVVTTGGRVVTVVGTGETVTEAHQKVYDNVERVTFQGSHFRRDIGLIEGEPPPGERPTNA